jgi:hypothetical protein
VWFTPAAPLRQSCSNASAESCAAAPPTRFCVFVGAPVFAFQNEKEEEEFTNEMKARTRASAIAQSAWLLQTKLFFFSPSFSLRLDLTFDI